jgi:hypothetical protein
MLGSNFTRDKLATHEVDTGWSFTVIRSAFLYNNFGVYMPQKTHLRLKLLRLSHILFHLTVQILSLTTNVWICV